MTTGQHSGPRMDPAGVALPDGAAYLQAVAPVDGSAPYWRVAAGNGATVIGELPVGELAQAELPPLAELVTDEDVGAARAAADAYARGGFRGGSSAMRAALEAYGARLLARHGRTP
jgi:hypothetical protein